MGRATPFRQLLRAWRLAVWCEERRVPTAKAIERREEALAIQPSRREVLGAAGVAALAASPLGAAARLVSAPRIAIVGGGLAGLACADRLQAKGVEAVVYEGASRLGGRCFSNRDLVLGMACENGGELIDTGHKTMLGYANEFRLPLESYIRKRGAESYWFAGRHWSEEDVVNQFRAVVANMQKDLRAISGKASAYGSNQADAAFDQLDLATYFTSRTRGMPLIEAVLNEAYVAEYGLETWRQSTLNFLGFMRLNKQSKFEPFGVSDERYHLVDGNDGIVQGLQAKLRGPVVTGARLTKLARTSAGQFQLFFDSTGTPETADAVVLAIPFTVLRQVELDASLGLSDRKRHAIAALGYGTNAKTMVVFDGRPWAELYGSGGGIYSDLPNLQNTWETNRARAARVGILTDYASGDRGAALQPANVQAQVGAFLHDLDVVLPGTAARALMTAGGNCTESPIEDRACTQVWLPPSYVAHLEHWPSNPFALGSYTCYMTGQFTTIAGLESEPAGLLKFAGEHADSFYSWQGYMEGACLSGIRAANEILADLKAGVL